MPIQKVRDASSQVILRHLAKEKSKNSALFISFLMHDFVTAVTTQSKKIVLNEVKDN